MSVVASVIAALQIVGAPAGWAEQTTGIVNAADAGLPSYGQAVLDSSLEFLNDGATTQRAGHVEADVIAYLGFGLKDPESVKTRGVKVIDHDGVKVVCGQFDAKNGYGAYTGYKLFLGTRLPVTQTSANEPMIAALWEKLCVQ